MNKSLYRKILIHSLIPLFLVVALFIHPYVSNIILILVLYLLIMIRITDIEKSKRRESASISKKGIINAVIAAPFLIIISAAILFGMVFGLTYLDNLIGKKTLIIMLFVVMLLYWIFDILVLIRKDQKQT
jgi:isoprenylcysteine carboxyl methyltransferase (ICMT) family protein YpbQ